jgi:SagB-type dehydrogenase family enzyme
MEFAPRPYPAAGGLYELELYPVVNHCEGVDPGIYHYEPLSHSLEQLSAMTGMVPELVRRAALGAEISPDHVQVLIVIAARFQRIAWKYSPLAYSLILKNVGVLLQTLYLTATAMRLAPCALGNGDSDLFARIAGTSYYDETSVGEFLLGSAREEPTARGALD